MNEELTDLQRALMAILKTRATGLPGELQAFTLPDLHVQLVLRHPDWPIREILPAHILSALNALRDRNLVRSDTYWRAVPQVKP